MSKFNLKSKLGFTLIELLVVIGILAVLAAIAIPSVAGLIDRANVSSDATNANEMTNAVERFTSEYELYLQDIASGKLDTSNLDSAQGRVYNVTGVTDRAGIENLEKSTSAGPDTTGKAIYRDTKYPVNAETMQAVVENYMKTSSSTFTPKQSDMHYWYSPEIGIVVVAKPNADVVTDLNSQVQSGNNAKGEELDGTTIWIDITINIIINGGVVTPDDGNQGGTGDEGNNTPSYNNPAGDIIPTGGKYYIGVTSSYYGNYSGATQILEAGSAFPETPNTGDVYVYEEYEYRYNKSLVGFPISWSTKNQNGWGVVFLNRNKSTAPEMLTEICGKEVNNLNHTFNSASITKSPQLPNNVISLDYTFASCQFLKEAPDISCYTSVTSLPNTFAMTGLTDISDLVIPSGITTMKETFSNSKITCLPDFSQAVNVTTMESTFKNCVDLIDASNNYLPQNVGILFEAFKSCENLQKAPVIPASAYYLDGLFANCTSLTGNVEINSTASKIYYTNIFEGTQQPIKVIGNVSNSYKQLFCATTDGNATY